MSFELFIQNAKAIAQADGRRVGPEDDWMPKLYLESYEGEIEVVGIGTSMMASPEAKDLLSEFMFNEAISHRAVRAAFVTCAWVAKADPELELEDQPEPSESPNREERLLLIAVDFDAAVMHTAQIVRRPGKPPFLRPWVNMADEGDSDSDEPDLLTFSGRFVDPLRLAIHLWRKMAEDPMGSLRDVVATSANEDSRQLAESLLEWAERNPEMIEHMPIRQWFKQREGT